MPSSLPAGWTVWHESADHVVYAFRPDVFDGGETPAPCMPTIHATRGRRDRRPGSERVGDEWHVTLYLEPEVVLAERTATERAAALDDAGELADALVAGALDPRDAYQVPRPEYLDRLEAVLAEESTSGGSDPAGEDSEAADENSATSSGDTEAAGENSDATDGDSDAGDES